MADLLQTGLQWLAGKLHDHVSTPVLYRRDDKSVTLGATLGSSIFTLDEVEGQRRTFTSIDFDVQAADLTWDSVQRSPVRGDEVVFDGRVYTVYSPAGERHWKWLSGLVGVRLRIHSKLVGSE